MSWMKMSRKGSSTFFYSVIFIISNRFIQGEIEKAERNVTAKQEEQKKLAEEIRSQQHDMRSKAADAARKVYEEASGGT